MSRYVIVTMPGASAPPPSRFADFAAPDPGPGDAGCAWLFSAASSVDDPEAALRAAVREFFASPEGRRVREGEGLERPGWCEVIPWIPEEVWERHGLTVFHHPDVERIILDVEEDLTEELPEVEPGRSAAGAAP